MTRFLIIPRALRYSSSKRACDSDGRPWPPTHRAISASGTASLVAVCSRVLRRRRSVLVSSAPKARNSAGLTAETSDGYSLVSAEETLSMSGAILTAPGRAAPSSPSATRSQARRHESMSSSCTPQARKKATITVLRGSRMPFSISATAVLERGLEVWRVLDSSVRSDGRSARRCTVRSRIARSSRVPTAPKSRSPVYGASSTPFPCPRLSADVPHCTARSGSRGIPAVPLWVQTVGKPHQSVHRATGRQARRVVLEPHPAG